LRYTTRDIQVEGETVIKINATAGLVDGMPQEDAEYKPTVPD